MKKIIKLFLLVPFIAFLACAFSTQVKADINYNISDVDVSANVNEDGSLTMSRLVTYDFDDAAHGVYSKQNVGEGMKIINPKVELLDTKKNKFVPIKRNDHGKNHYQLAKKGNNYTFKVWHPIASDDTVTLCYTFKITNAITNWKDTAELNYKIIGNNWGQDLDNVSVNVMFPGAVKGLKAWAHGPLSGKIKVSPKKGIISLTAEDLPKNEGIELHAIFPNSVTDQNKNVKNQNHRNFVLQQEKGFADQTNDKRLREQRLAIACFIAGILCILMAWIVVASKYFKASRPKRLSQLTHSYEIPKVDPVTAQMLDTGEEPNAKAVVASLLWMAGKRQISVTPVYDGDRVDSYTFKAANRSVLKSGLMTYLFLKLGRNLVFNTNDLKRAKRKPMYYVFKDWRNIWTESSFRNGFFNREASYKIKDYSYALPNCLFVLTVFGFFVSFYFARAPFAFYVMVYGVISLIIGLIVYFFLRIFIGRKYLVYRKEGVATANQIRSFKKMLKNIGRFKMRDVGDIVLWEQILPYAAAFGLAKKVIKQLQIEFPEEEIEQMSIYQNIFDTDTYQSFASDLDHKITSNYQQQAFLDAAASKFSGSDDSGYSSPSGGSGDFSSGDSGGFGDDSGDGAF